MNHRPHFSPIVGLCRDTERGVIGGVCAGIAERFDWPLWLTRLSALALAWVFPIPALIAYLVAVLVLPQRPLRYGGQGEEQAFWRSHRQGD